MRHASIASIGNQYFMFYKFNSMRDKSRETRPFNAFNVHHWPLRKIRIANRINCVEVHILIIDDVVLSIDSNGILVRHTVHNSHIWMSTGHVENGECVGKCDLFVTYQMYCISFVCVQNIIFHAFQLFIVFHGFPGCATINLDQKPKQKYSLRRYTNHLG